jgi:hypothetical protein
MPAAWQVMCHHSIQCAPSTPLTGKVTARHLLHPLSAPLAGDDQATLQAACLSNQTAGIHPYHHACDGTSQVIRPTYSCPCPTDLRQPCRCSWITWQVRYLLFLPSQERFTRHADITNHRRYENAEAVTKTYLYLKVGQSYIITDQDITYECRLILLQAKGGKNPSR